MVQTLNLATKATHLANCVISGDGWLFYAYKNWHSREIYHNDNVVSGIL
ncbi:MULTISPECIES: hypothetical protein [Campylobacter]|nr:MULTISPECIES: hypothetical protein [Campylobacter]